MHSIKMNLSMDDVTDLLKEMTILLREGGDHSHAHLIENAL